MGRVSASGQPDGHAAAAFSAAPRRKRAHADDAGARRERQRRADRGGGAVLCGAEGRRHGNDHGPIPARGARDSRVKARRRLDGPQYQVVRKTFRQGGIVKGRIRADPPGSPSP